MFSQLLEAPVDVLEDSDGYANCGKSKLVRQYVDISLPDDSDHFTHFDAEASEFFKSVDLSTG